MGRGTGGGLGGCFSPGRVSKGVFRILCFFGGGVSAAVSVM